MDFARLAGKRARLAGVELQFDVDHFGRPAVWAGGEGFAARVTISETVYVLKSPRLPTPERRARTTFLASLDLAGISGCRVFWGAPACEVVGVLEDVSSGPASEPLRIEGYVSRFFAGSELDKLRTEGWEPETQQRIDLATQLCLGVEILEKCGIAHGDLSPANIMVGERDGALMLAMIDFDGFFHADVPLIPVSTKKRGGRPTGTPGFKAPAFKGKDGFVNSDRLSLAILVTELMVLQVDDWKRLQRNEPTLLSQAILNSRTLDLPGDILERWPTGFALLARAIQATHPAQGPSPAEWRQAVGAASLLPQRSTLYPRKARALKVKTLQLGSVPLLRALQTQSGDLSVAHPSLGWLGYEDSFQELRLRGVIPPPKAAAADGARNSVFVRHGGADKDPTRYDGDIRITLQTGDVLFTNIDGTSLQIEIDAHVN